MIHAARTFVIASLLALAPSAAQAAGPGRPEGKVRLHVDTEFFGWTQVRGFYDPREDPPPGNPRTNVVGFGALRPLRGDAAADQVPYVLQPLIGLGVGYGVHKNIVVGVRTGFNFDRVRNRNDIADPNVFSVSRAFSAVMLPYLEILPIAEGRILPFIMFRGGFSGAVLGDRTVGELAGVPFEELDRTGVLAPQVGLGAGAHFFVTPGFSLDLSGNFDYRWIFARERQFGANADPPGPWDRRAQSFTLSIGFGLSAWF